jgi:hypothetical protein
MIYKPYSSGGGVPGTGQANVRPTPYPQSTLLGAFTARLPYALQIVDNLVRNNPKFYDFKNQASLRDEMIQDQSVFLGQSPNADNYSTGTPGSFAINKDYQAFVYANLDKDKQRRLMDYRRMAAYAELADCLDEIADECIVKDDNEEIVKFKLAGKYSSNVQDTISKEFQNFIQVFDLENSGWEKFRQLLVEGELFFENLIKQDKKELGVIGTMSIPSELINPVYHNVQNELIKGYLLVKPIIGPTQSINTEDQEELMFLQKAQVTYVNSGLWNEFKTIRIPFIENSKRAYRQLSLIEDSVVIYRLVRAPERLVFKVYTGNMPPPKAESYIKGLMSKYWSKKTFNSAESRTTNIYDPQSMLDSYWFPVDAQGKGTDVSTLASAGCLAMNTKVPLLDGRTLSLAEMTTEHEQGKQNWVYSTNPNTGEVVPGLVSWAGVTQKSAKVMELTFDNNETLICTPDHKFPIIGKGFVEAKDLLVGESMIPFNTKREKIYSKSNEYEMVYQNHSKSWEFTHRMVNKNMTQSNHQLELVFDEKYAAAPKNVVHHKDLNRFNNNPINLVQMNKKDHAALHANLAFKCHNDPKIVEKRIDMIRKGWAKAKDTNSESYQKCFTRGSDLLKTKWADPEFRAKKIDHQTFAFDKSIFDFALSMISGKTTHQVTGKQVIAAINADDNLRNHFLNLNKDKKPKNWDRTGFKFTHLAYLAKQFGYRNWHHLRQEAKYFNHKLISVRYLEEPIEVGTLTIDQHEEYHDFHTFALACGVFTKNSLGDIKDLDYFLTKLYKSLKVPVSRFLTPGDAFKDGNEITRDELRFARFIMRLQTQFAAGIKQSFVTHLKLKGLWTEYGIKEQSLKIKFNEPTSFMTMRNQQLQELKFTNFNNATQNDSIAKSYAQKHYLGMTSELMKENREWLRIDAALRWELAQIEASGPTFREQIAAQAAPAGGGEEMGGGSEMGGGGGMPSLEAGGGEAPGAEAVPEFGGTPEAGGAAPEVSAPAPEAGGGAPETPSV